MSGSSTFWFVFYMARPIRAVQNFLARPLMQKMFSGPSLFATRCRIIPFLSTKSEESKFRFFDNTKNDFIFQKKNHEP